MADKLCLRRKSWTKGTLGHVLDSAKFFHIENFASCLGEKCPLHVVSDDPENKSFCIDLLILDAQLTNLVYGNPPREKKSEDKPGLRFVQCKRCGGGYGHSDTGLCSVCQKFSAKETDSKK